MAAVEGAGNEYSARSLTIKAQEVPVTCQRKQEESGGQGMPPFPKREKGELAIWCKE